MEEQSKESSRLIQKKVEINDSDEYSKPSSFLNARHWDVDLLRGLVLMFLAIDHTLSSFHKVIISNTTNATNANDIWWQPINSDPEKVLFFTYQICKPMVPGLFLLMGMGMQFSYRDKQASGWSDGRILVYFFKRALYLIVLEVVIDIPFQAWEQLHLAERFPYPEMKVEPPWVVSLGLLWGLGITMIFAACIILIQQNISKTYCILLPTIPFMEDRWGIFFLSVMAMTVNALSTYVRLYATDPLNVGPGLWIFFIPGLLQNMDDISWPAFYSQYNIFPWLGIVLIGAVVGQRISSFKSKSYPSIGLTGGLFIFLFLLMRVTCYDDLFCIINQKYPKNYWTFWVLTQYPPELAFIFWSVGLNLVVLFTIKETLGKFQKKWVLQPLRVFGRTPLLFLILHKFVNFIMAEPFPSGVVEPAWIYGELALLLFILFPICLLVHTKKEAVEARFGRCCGGRGFDKT
eukprot:TRINITY_DN3167_c0_g1_i1.p1 TRINITY_DN3167_c0_g1~~TRINITY_DN3167_c0_g1_i1.p1  ORF type:complete len:461 (-),score=51.57 TRINITY_DN3167_c0_g1_i1:17-1399(-)